MIGQLLALRARARWLSLGTLLVYLCLLTVTTFAHQCGRPDTVPAPVTCTAKAGTGYQVSEPHAALTGVQHECLACALARQTISTLTIRFSINIDRPLLAATALSPTTDPLCGISLPHPSRGPPTS